MGFWSWLGGAATSVVNTFTGGLLHKVMGWDKVDERVQQPVVVNPPAPNITVTPAAPQVVVQPPNNAETNVLLRAIADKLPQPQLFHALLDKIPQPQPPPLPFKVVEPSKGKKNPQAFDHLVGMSRQQAMLQFLSAMMWVHWRQAERIVRSDRRQRVAFLLFTGRMGTGKTAHARAFADFFGIPCVLVSSGNAKFVSSDGLSMMNRVLDYCMLRKSAVVLLDEIDVYVDDEGFMAEVRQVVDGAFQIDEDAVLFIIGITNKDIANFPADLLHRVLLHVPFGEPQRFEPPSNASNDGFDRDQCEKFWERNAKCLSREDRHKLADISQGCVPRDLQLWTQKVVIDLAYQGMREESESGDSTTKMKPPTLASFMEASPTAITGRKAAAEFNSPCLFDGLSKDTRDAILDVTSFVPQVDPSTGISTYTRNVPRPGDEGVWSLVVKTQYEDDKEFVREAYVERKRSGLVRDYVDREDFPAAGDLLRSRL